MRQAWVRIQGSPDEDHMVTIPRLDFLYGDTDLSDSFISTPDSQKGVGGKERERKRGLLFLKTFWGPQPPLRI